ncbi:uncharacterized protein LOC132194310 [Neocloeon triangulifer]|uniref:uncharacterized protein LOC132194310 n=1 Tax=Neocloeon triangulifer TaxID=2078957 RepID=UPI00286EE4AF|nr:uncharacterized protein LOC132194310 [Neocloeon triangulifer]
MWPQASKLMLIGLIAGVTASPIVNNRDSKFLFKSLLPFHHHLQQQSSFFYRTPLIHPPAPHHPDPVDPMPYADYPIEGMHPPEPEPEPFFTRFAAPPPLPEPEHNFPNFGNFQNHEPVITYTSYSIHKSNPSNHLEPPPKQPSRAGPVRVFFLFSRFPWPLEPVVQRVQNYFSTYSVPTVEPLLDEEVDLGPAIEEVDDIESQLALGPTTTAKPDKLENNNQNISNSTEKDEEPAIEAAVQFESNSTTLVNRIESNQNSTLESERAEETSTETEEEDTTTEEITTISNEQNAATTQSTLKIAKVETTTLEPQSTSEYALRDLVDYSDDVIISKK